jgi:TP901 family phage tail tape measure protein
MPIKIPVVQTGLEASIQAAAQKAGKSLKINMGSGAKSIEGLSQPLGRITGKADQFTKSMEAANARVLAFGASVGVLSAVTRGFQNLVVTTIEVEKSLASINSILGTSDKQLKDFGKTIFDVAKNTEQSFDTVANAALELSRQGLSAEEVQKRLSDSLILTRLSGLGASEAVAGLTAAINSFNKEGLSSAEVLNKLSAAAVSAAVSERDLIEGIKRSGSVAVQAGVSFDELIGVITAVQKTTARGGAVIGNSFKTIFTRIQSIEKLETMQNLGVQVTDASGQVLGATKLIQNLAKVLGDLPDAKKLQIAEGLVGKFQIAPFLAILEDYNKETSTAIEVTKTASSAFNEAYSRNIALNDTLSASINKATVNLKELANALGEIGVTDSLKNLLGFFNSLVGDIKEVLDGEGVGGDMARGIVKGISSVISGPGLAIFGAIILKLTADLARFGVGSLKTFFGLNKAAQAQATLQGQIASTLLGNESIQKQILAIENSQLSVGDKRKAQTKFFTTALNEQVGIMTRMQNIAATIAPGVMGGTKKLKGRGAGGFIPNYNAVAGYGSESSDISKGVGGAPSSARPVTIPNFNFGGGQKGTMIANNSEYMVPNFAGGDGSAIFNQDMISSMGLPAGARKIGAAGGYIPNFAAKGSKSNPIDVNYAGLITPRKKGGTQPKIGKFGSSYYRFPVYGIDSAGERARETEQLTKLVREYSISKSREESKFMTGGDPLAANITKLSNQGSIGSLAGSIFETALSSLLKSPEFDMGETGTFDFVGKKAVANISQLSPSLKGSKVNFLEAKISDEARHLNSMAKKIVTYFGPSAGGKNITGFGRNQLQKGAEKSFSNVQDKGSLNINAVKGDRQNSINRAIGLAPNSRGVIPVGPRGASGYIPNFAGGLGDAIARESAAGLPINQIRINQDSSLKNAGNPMGLAVTNTRDEPTGAIPNFADGMKIGGSGFAASGVGPRTPDPPKLAGSLSNLTKSVNQSTKSIKATTQANNNNVKGQRDMLGGIFATQIAFSALSGATSEMDDGFGRVVNRLATMGSSITTAAFAGSAINDFGKSIGGATGTVVSKLGIYGAAISAGISIFKGANQIYEDTTGETERTAAAMDRLKDVTNELSVSFDTLNAAERGKIERDAKSVVDGVDFTNVDSIIDNLEGWKKTTMDFLSSEFFDRDFANDDVEKGFLDATKIMLRFGKTTEQVDSMLDQFGDDLSENDLQDFIDTLKVVGTEFKKQSGKETEAFEKMLEGLTLKELQEEKKNPTNFDISSFDSIIPMGNPFSNANLVDPSSDSIIPMGDPFSNANLAPFSTIGTSARETLTDKELKKREIAAEKVDRINTSLAKQEIQFAIDRAKADRTVLDQMDQKILKSELIKSLTEEEMISLKTEKSVLQANFDLRGKTLDAVGAMAKESKELTFESAKDKELRDLILATSKKTEITEAERKDLIQQTKSLLSESTGEIRLALEKSIEGLSIEEDKTKALIEQFKLLGLIKGEASRIANIRASKDISFIGAAEQTTFDRVQGRTDAIEARKNTRAARETGAFSIRESEALQRQAAKDSLLDAQDKSENQIDNLNLGIEKKIQTTLKALGPDAQRDIIKGFNPFLGGGTTSISDMIEDKGSGQVLQKAIDIQSGKNSSEGIRLAAELTDFRDSIARSRIETEAQGEAAKASAEANLKATGFFQKSAAQLSGDLATQLRRGTIQGGIDAQMIVDPAQRAKALRNERSREARANALDDQNFKEFRRLVEEDQFAGQLIDASAQFAQNIGNAMTQAIAKGEDLGDLLLGVASSFFNTISQAFMQKAVNNIISGFNAGGQVRGGSGNRDDVPALLTGGEFVMKKSSVNKYGSSFMAALNSGAVPTMQRGGLFTPGTYGQGAMKGKDNLLDFATQGFTTGNFDKARGGSGFASVNLAPQSAALTMFGRRNSPAFQREQASKEAAFGLFTQQANKEAELKERNAMAKKGLLASVGSALFSFGFNSLTDLFSKKATGGSIPYTSGVDTVPTMLSGGEFVMNAAATQRIGRGNLNALNSGGGGGSGDVVGKLDELISVSDNSGETIINITVNSDGSSNSQGNGDDQQNSLATKIKDVVRQVIDDEKRLGGSLRQARA